MIVKLPTGHQFEFLSLKGGCTGSSQSTLVKMPYCWKSHVTAHLLSAIYCRIAVGASLIFMILNSDCQKNVYYFNLVL